MQSVDEYLSLQEELGQGTDPTIDLDALMPLVAMAVGATVVITLACILYAIFSSLRRRKVERAVFDTQKDIRRIRELLEQQGSTTPTPPPAAAEHRKTSRQQDVIAAHTDTNSPLGSEDQNTQESNIEQK